MRRFISKKRIKLPRYKIYFLKLIFFFLFILFLNISLNIYLSKTNHQTLLNTFGASSFGNLLPSYNLFTKDKLFYHNVYGFSPDIPVSNTNSNITDLLVSKPVVYLYNTFQTSKYKNNYYNTYNINPVVTEASLIFQEYLKKEEIPALVELESVAKTLKDNNIPYNLSYRGSRLLLEKAYNNNKSLKYFFDLQISDSNYEDTTISIDNKSYAKILFVVGTDNNAYHDNEVFARNLNDLITKFNPNLTRGISLRGGEGYQGVYNQDFNTNCLLIQVGGHENTIAEVNRTLKVLSAVFSSYLKEHL